MFWKPRFLFCTIEQGAAQTGKLWLKFFQNSQGLQINIERSLKNEASEQLNSFVKSNYKTFTNDQLYLAFIKRDLNYEASKVVQLEVLDRTASLNMELSNEQFLDFFDKNLDLFSNLNTIQSGFFVINGLPLVDQMNFNQLVQYIKLQNKSGYLHSGTFKRFISLLKIDDQFMEQFSLMTFKHVILILECLSSSPYDHGLQPGFMEYLFSQYAQKLNNYEIVASELINMDLSTILLPHRPHFIGESQYQEIKIAYAKIIEKAYNKNYSFITPKQMNHKEVASKIINLYQPDDFHMLYNAIHNLIKTVLSQDQKIEQVFYQLMKYFKYFQPQLYFIAFNACQKQNLLVYNSRIDMRLIYSLISNNCFQGFRSIFSDFSAINEAETNIKKLIQTYLASISDEDLLNFEEIFQQNLELPIDYEFVDTDYNDLAMFIPKQINSKEPSALRNQKEFIQKMSETFKDYQQQFQQLNFVKSLGFKYNRKITQLEPLLQYIEALSLILILEPQFEVTRKVFQSPLVLKLVEKLHYMPNFFDSIVQISQRWPHLFSAELLGYIKKNKYEIDEFYNSCQTPQQFIDKVEDEISKHNHRRFWRSKQYDRQFSQNLNSFNFVRARPHEVNHELFKNFIPEYTLDETYSNNARNKCIRLALRSDTLVQHTHFKEQVRNALETDTYKWKMNYSDFPYLVDFIQLEQKVVIFLSEYPRLIRGLKNVHTLETQQAAEYYRAKDYQVVFLDYSTYYTDKSTLLSILRQRIVYRYNN